MEEELESLEAEANRNIDLKEFIPLASVDPVYFEDTHYLAADKGGQKPYRLIAEAMAKSDVLRQPTWSATARAAPAIATVVSDPLRLVNQTLNLPLEFKECKWLDDVVAASGVNTGFNVGGLDQCRDREDRNILSFRICS